MLYGGINGADGSLDFAYYSNQNSLRYPTALVLDTDDTLLIIGSKSEGGNTDTYIVATDASDTPTTVTFI